MMRPLMPWPAGLLLGLCGLLAACGPTEKQQQAAALQAAWAQCPAHASASITKTRTLLNGLEAGRTKTRWLAREAPPDKTMWLSRAMEPSLQVYFYRTALPGCTWLNAESTYVPVVVQPGRKGRVLGYGRDTLKTLQAQGWVLGYRIPHWFRPTEFQPTPWPWQNWNYDYLPKN